MLTRFLKMEFLVFGGPWAGLAAVRTCHGKDGPCLVIRRLGPVRQWRDGSEQVLREGKLFETTFWKWFHVVITMN